MDVLILILAAVGVVLGVVNFLRKPPMPDFSATERRMIDEIRNSRMESNELVTRALNNSAERQTATQKQISEIQDSRLRDLSTQMNQKQTTLQATVQEQMTGLDNRFKNVSMQNEQKLESIRKTVEGRLQDLQIGNEKKLDEMRHTVDEKLHRTLDERLKQNFSLVNERLEQVHKGLGEMQNLAQGVGDLKKVLSNVKTRGILGEMQLGAILEEILSNEQYASNVETVKGSGYRVEYAIKLPGDEDGQVWLPLDAKFPSDAYATLLDAYDSAEPLAVDAAAKELEKRLRGFAKDIHDKYVRVPETTEFAIMFLPVEGLYAEAVRLGLVERLQREYKISIAGPTTMAALLNSLQMGFRTLAIQKRSGEVWVLLNDVKTEFGKFETSLSQAQERIKKAGDDLELLVGVRTRQMNRKLSGITKLPSSVDKEAEAITEAELPKEIQK